jgi:ATP-dependent Clp protease ATP-binding subunit ClpA
MAESIALTPDMHRALGRAEEIARSNGHSSIRTEHVLLALLSSADSVAAQVVAMFADVDQIADEVRRVMGSEQY